MGSPEKLPKIAMICSLTQEGGQSQLQEKELDHLRGLLGLPGIQAGCAHVVPQCHPAQPRGGNQHRLTLMMRQGQPEEVYVMDHSPGEWAANPGRRVEPWRGLTIFYTIQDIKEPLENFYVQTPKAW